MSEQEQVDGDKAFQSIKEFEESVMKDQGIQIRLSELTEKMIVGKQTPEFTEEVIKKIIAIWQEQQFESAQESLRGLNAMIQGALIALKL
jgi:hypothetical protein